MNIVCIVGAIRYNDIFLFAFCTKNCIFCILYKEIHLVLTVIIVIYDNDGNSKTW